MQTRTHNTFAPFSWLDMDRVFDHVLDSAFRPAPRRERFPAANVWESDAAFHVEAEVPGVAQDDVEITVEKATLTIQGRRKPAETNEGVLRLERPSGEFSRSLTLPAELDAERVEAALSDGILTITLPKAAEVRPRRIEVKVG